MHGFWTEERLKILTARLADNKTFVAIAAELGTTKNAVIGKAHRMGLLARARYAAVAGRPRSHARYDYQVRRIATRKAAKVKADAVKAKATPPEPKAEVIPLRPRPLGIVDLERRHCRWPIGDPGDPDFHFCGRHRAASSPYCAQHTKEATRPR